MSFDLLVDNTARLRSDLRPIAEAEPGVWDNFMLGAGKFTMQGLAKTGRAVDLLGAVGPIVQDKITGGTEAQGRYFREHDEIFNRAVDYWTPKPRETGVAAEIVGSLASTLPMVIASPALAVGSAQLSSAEDLTLKGVSAGKAQAVGAVQGAGLGLGIWAPIMGATGWQRMLVGGAGFNVLQGIGTRGASGAILMGTQAEGDFKAFDPASITLDALLGVAFGGIAHLSPTQRAQGANAWKRIGEWAKGVKPSDVDALATLRQAEHLNSDSMPGRPAGPVDIEAHVTAMRQAIDDLLHDRPVDVHPLIEAASFLPEPARAQVQTRTAAYLNEQAKALIGEGAAGEALRSEALSTPGFLRTAEQLIALQDRTDSTLHPEIQRAIEVAAKPGFERTQEERILLDAMLGGRAQDYALPAHTPEQVHAALKAEGMETSAENVSKVQMIARARSLDAKAVDALPGRMPDDEYLAKIKEIVNAHEATQGANTRGPETGGAGTRATTGEAGAPAQGGEAAGRTGGEARPGSEGAGRVDVLAVEAERFAAQHPNFEVTLGRNPDGSPITTSVAKMMEDARLLSRDAAEGQKLAEVAAACLLGGP